jgi:hypothetical protein
VVNRSLKPARSFSPSEAFSALQNINSHFRPFEVELW